MTGWTPRDVDDNTTVRDLERLKRLRVNGHPYSVAELQAANSRRSNPNLPQHERAKAHRIYRCVPPPWGEPWPTLCCDSTLNGEPHRGNCDRFGEQRDHDFLSNEECAALREAMGHSTDPACTTCNRVFAVVAGMIQDVINEERDR